jgi:hypothetical protein
MTTRRAQTVGLIAVALSMGTACLGTIDGGDPAGGLDPGRVTTRRLNATEYDNTIRDLLGVDLRPSRTFEFLPDEFGDGFDNDGDVLSLAPISIEKYLAAARASIERALDPQPANAAVRARIVVCAPPATPEAECGRRILEGFTRRAFRRTLASGEIDPYLGLIDLARRNGDSFEVGLAVALSAVLVSPDFLFRPEIDPVPGKTRPLGGFELASRLSYFLWASMPDDELLARAESGALADKAEIGRQVRRMLADGKAGAFTNAMVGQWMHTIALDFAKPDNRLYPRWQEPLRAAMAAEVRAFLAPILAGQAPAQDLLLARYTYANRPLAQYYGLPGAERLPIDRFERIDLPDASRGGVLRQGSFLVATSHPDTHSPTRRGKWILERLLCRKPPPPPPNVPGFQPAQVAGGTLRQKLERTHHAMGGTCAACHAFIDPMGFALEHYDGAGLWRDQDGGLPIDASGAMPDTDVPFDGAGELSAAIAADPRFPACVAKQVMTYALGRHLTEADQPAIDALGARFQESGFSFPALVEQIAQSPLLTHRRAEKETP